MTNGTDNPNAHHVRQADADREYDRRETDGLERRHMDAEFRAHVLREIDTIKEEQKVHGQQLNELLTILRTSKVGAAILARLADFAKWMAIVGGAVGTTYAVFHDKLPK